MIYIGNIADTNQPIVLLMDGSENYIAEALALRYSVKKVFLEISQNSQENICARFSFLIKLQASDRQFYEKKTLAQVLSCEFYEIFKKTFSYRTPPVAALKFVTDNSGVLDLNVSESSYHK